MKTILKTAKNIVGWLLVRLNDLKADATPAVLKYIELLERLATKGIGIPLAVAAVAFLGYGITTTFVDVLQYWGWTGRFWSWIALLLPKTGGLWSSLIALAGIISFSYAWLCSVLVSPVGILAHASVPGARSVPSARVEVSWATLPDSLLTEIRDAKIGIANALHTGVEKYVRQVKFVLTFIGGTYLVAALFPGMRGMIFQLILGALFLTAMREFKNPIASFLRFAICVAFLWFIAAQTFPALNPFRAVFGNGPEAVTMGDVKTTVQSLWDSTNKFFLEGWKEPAFWLLIVAVAPFLYLAYQALLGLKKKVSAKVAGEGDHHPTSATHSESHHHSSGGGNGKLGTVVATIIALLVGWFVWSSMTSWNEQRVADEVRRHTIAVNEAVRREAATKAAVRPPDNGGVPRRSLTPAISMASPSIIATAKQGLRNPKGYVLSVSSEEFSPGVPLPSDMSFRIEPEGFPTVIQVNGEYIWERIPGALNIVPDDVKFLCIKAKDSTTRTNIIVWVGK